MTQSNRNWARDDRVTQAELAEGERRDMQYVTERLRRGRLESEQHQVEQARQPKKAAAQKAQPTA